MLLSFMLFIIMRQTVTRVGTGYNLLGVSVSFYVWVYGKEKGMDSTFFA